MRTNVLIESIEANHKISVATDSVEPRRVSFQALRGIFAISAVAITFNGLLAFNRLKRESEDPIFVNFAIVTNT